MTNYYNYLIKQYKESCGIKEDVSLDKFLTEFDNWLKERSLCGEVYLNLLKSMGININTSDTYEIGKGNLDSIVANYPKTNMITPFYDRSNFVSDRTIIGTFGVFHSKPTLIRVNKGMFDLTTLQSGITCMTQNTYTSKDILNWDLLHNSGNVKIIVGIYGNTSDCDRNKKIRELKMLRDKLTSDYIEERLINGNIYCSVIASKEKVKK